MFFLDTYLLSKLLPLIFSPLGIVLILLLFFIIKNNRKFIYSVFIFLIVFSNGLVSEALWRLLEYPWKRLDYSSVEYSDGIVVLSSRRHLPPGNTKIIEWYDPDRFFSGIDLYKADKADKLIFTGGINPFNSGLPPEGNIYIMEAISMGIPKKNLFTTYPVTNTIQEAKAIMRLLNSEILSSQKKIILVTSAFHMTRAKKVFEREGLRVIPYPVDFKSNKGFFPLLRNPLSWVPSSYYFYKSSSAIREIVGRTIYGTWK